MVIFRENSEDIYAGVEFESGSAEGKKCRFSLNELNIKKIRFLRHPVWAEPISKEGTDRLVSLSRYLQQ